jgi:FtsH-binding integral membrane protein
MKDWKTTTVGIFTILVGVVTGVVLPMLNGHPVNTAVVLTALTTGATGILASDSK